MRTAGTPSTDYFAFVGENCIESNGHMAMYNYFYPPAHTDWFGLPGDSQFYWPGQNVLWQEFAGWWIAGNFKLNTPGGFWTSIKFDSRPLTELGSAVASLWNQPFVETVAEAESTSSSSWFKGPLTVRANTWCEYVVQTVGPNDTVLVDLGEGPPVFGTANSYSFSFLHNFRRGGVFEPSAILFTSTGIPYKRLFLRGSTLPHHKNHIVVANVSSYGAATFGSSATSQSLAANGVSGVSASFNGVNLTNYFLPSDSARNLGGAGPFE